MKKLLCFALTLAMLLTLVPLTVFATTTPQGNPGSSATTLTDLDREKLADTSATYVCRIGDGTTDEEYFTSFGEAIGYMGSTYGNNVTSINMTVTLIRDITTTDQWMTATSSRNQIKAGSAAANTQLIIEGNGCTIAPTGNTTSSNKSLSWLFEWTGGFLAFRNVTVNATGGITTWMQPNSTLKCEFTNCTFNITTNKFLTAPKANNDAGGDWTSDIDITNCIINCPNRIIDTYESKENTIADNAHTLDIVNSTLTQNYTGTARERAILAIKDNDPWTVNINGSTLKSEGTRTLYNESNTGDPYGDYECMIMIKTHMTMNVTNGSVLENAVISDNHDMIIRLFSNAASQNSNVTLNFDATTKMKMSGTYARSGAAFIGINKNVPALLTTLTLNDAGTTYVVGKAAAATGVNMPATAPTVAAGETFLGWAGAGTVAAAGAKYTNANAPEAGVELTPFTVASDDFVMKTGAGIRTADPIGIRFTAKVSDDLLAKIADSGLTATYSTVIAPNKYVTEAGGFVLEDMLDGDYLIATQTTAPNAADADAEGYVAYYAALVGMDCSKAWVTMDFAAMGMLTLSDGTNEIVLYTDFNTTDNVRSMLKVAQDAYAAGTTDNALINQIIAVGTAS